MGWYFGDSAIGATDNIFIWRRLMKESKFMGVCCFDVLKSLH
jgi:hypothetical protein